MSTKEVALTAHLLMPVSHAGDAFLMDAAHQLSERFGIGHATLQIETSVDAMCKLAPDDLVDLTEGHDERGARSNVNARA